MQLLEHFKPLTLHPKNAQELKGLILQLAVQGKLTAQWREENPNVEPASILLERIKDEKSKLVKEKKIKKEKMLPGIMEDEIPFQIPGSWIWCRLQDYLDVRDGTHDTPKYVEDGIPLVTSKNLYTKKLDISNIKYISEKDHIEISKRSNVERDDILFAMIGSIGNPVIVDIEPNFSIKNVALIKYFLKEFSLPQYILFFLEYATQQFKDDADGAVQSFVSLTKLRLKELPLPPLEEQKAIVEVVNQLFAEVELLEDLTKKRIQLKADYVTSALQQLTQAVELDTAAQWDILQKQFGTFFTEKENIKKLRESILQLAVQGKLTRDWRSSVTLGGVEVESATTLLERIKAEKAQLIKAGKIKKEKMISPMSDDEIPFSIPENWVWCRMQDLCPNISSGSTPPKPYFKEEGIPYLKVYNIRNQKIDFGYREQFVDEKYHSTKLKRSILKPGDVIMNIVGPPLGKVAIIPNDFPEWNCNQAISFFQPLDKKLNTWIYTFLLAGSFLDHIELIGTAGQDHISVTKSKTIPIPLPPFEEQKVIVEKVNILLGFCDKLEKEIETHQSTHEDWMRSCLGEVLDV